MGCLHLRVTVYSKMVSPPTRYEPAVYRQWAQCDEDDCGKVLDISDIPAVADEKQGDPDLWDIPEWDHGL